MRNMNKAVSVVCALLLTMGLFSVPALALDIEVDGYVGDWGVSSPTSINGNDWTPSDEVQCWWQEDWVGRGGYLGPGYGGQDFDVEAMYAYMDGQDLYLAIVTGFDQEGEDGYRPGAIFFDFGQDGYDVAVRTNERNEGEVWEGTTAHWWTDPSPYPAGTPFEVNRGSADYLGRLSDDEFVYNDNAYGRYHNVIEMVLSLEDAWYDSILEGGLRAHWTMGCGNDVGEISCEAPVVPEPSTSMLVALGVAGLVLRRKLRV